MFKKFLKGLGYLHISEIKGVLDKERDLLLHHTAPQEKFKEGNKNTAWWKERLRLDAEARVIEDMKRALEIKQLTGE